MVYSSGVTGVVSEALKQHGVVVAKRVETSDPVDLDIAFVKSELEPATTTSSSAPIVGDEKKLFAKPRGPTRKR
jgi:twinfilin-like protein